MNNQPDKEVTDFLKDGITYLENRIAIVDNKASILFAVQGVIFVVFAYVFKELFLTANQSCTSVAGYVFLGGAFVAFVMFILVMLALLQTIRPSKKFFGRSVPLKHMEIQRYYVMWYDDDKFPTTPEDYSERVSTLDSVSIRQNYEEVHFVHLQLVRRKYEIYRWAVVGMKVLVVWCALGIIALALLNVPAILK